MGNGKLFQSATKRRMAAAPSSEPNYYQILGVSSRVDPKSLRRAFHHLTKLHHPDRNPTHLERFKEISRAYRVLSDPEKRREYDAKLLRSIQQRQMRDFMVRSAAATAHGGDRRYYNYQQPQHHFYSPQTQYPHRQQQQQQRQSHPPPPPPSPPHQQRQQQHHHLHQPHHHHPQTHRHHHQQQQHQLPTWDTSRVQVVRCAVCHGTGTVAGYERLGHGLMRETRALCSACSGRGTWCKLYSLQT